MILGQIGSFLQLQGGIKFGWYVVKHKLYLVYHDILGIRPPLVATPLGQENEIHPCYY